MKREKFSMSRRRRPQYGRAFVVCVGIILGCFMSAPSGVAQDYQKVPVTFHVKEILPKEVIESPYYKINKTVRNDGLINTYELETASGSTTVESTALLYIRLNELRAIERMAELKKTDVYKEALTKTGTKPLETAKDMITSPIDTTKNVVSGVGKWFGDVGRAVMSDDPYQEGVLKTAIGYAPAKRQFAFQFGVDPYSSYEPLQEALNEVTWTAVGGSLTVKVAFMAIPAPAQMAVKLSGTAGGMKTLVRDKSPNELENINRERLAAMGIEEGLAEAFLHNQLFNPQEKTLLVGALARMAGVANRSRMIIAAAPVNDVTVALYMRQRAEFMALYAERDPVQRVVMVSAAPFLRTKSGKLVGIFPLDHVRWTKMVAQREQVMSESLEKMFGNVDKAFWVTGSVDPEARKNFESKGWTVQERIHDLLVKS